MNRLARYGDHTYALLRIVAGLMLAFHGAQKILGFYSTFMPPTWTQLWFGGLIELVGGLAVAIGLGTRPAAFLCSGMMLAAYLQFHWKFQLGPNFFPAINKGETALLFSGIFLLIACRGAVKWGIERK